MRSLRCSKARTKRMGRWLSSWPSRRSSRRGRGRAGAAVMAKGISGGGGVGHGRCGGFGASECSGIGLLDREEGGGASGHGSAARGRRWLRELWRRVRGSVGYGEERRGREQGESERVRAIGTTPRRKTHGVALSRGRRQAGRWRGSTAVRARRAHARRPTGAVEMTTGSWASGPHCWAG